MSDISSLNQWRGLVSIILVGVIMMGGCVKKTHFAPVLNGWLQPNAKKWFYRVKEGDTIYSIAWDFGLDYRSLVAANHLHAPYTIETGTLLHMTNISRNRNVLPKLLQKSAKPFSWPHHPPIMMSLAKLKLVSHWQWPAKGHIIGRYATTMIVGNNHGIDIAGYYGEPVRAAYEGVVVYSGSGVRGYGNLIIVKHNKSYLSAYAFNKRILVKKGIKVLAGQKIAEMGRTDSGRVMLHFEIRRNGKPVNPLHYLS